MYNIIIKILNIILIFFNCIINSYMLVPLIVALILMYILINYILNIIENEFSIIYNLDNFFTIKISYNAILKYILIFIIIFISDYFFSLLKKI